MENNKLKDKVTIEIYSIIRDVLRNLWLVVLAAITGLMISFIIKHSVYVPEYTSKATLVVNSKIGNGATSANITLSSQMANVFSEIFVQPSMKDRAAKYLGESFNASLSTRVLENTNILEVYVTAKTPQKAYRDLCAVLIVYPDISDSIFSNAVIDVIKMPYMPKGPSNTMPESNELMIVGGLSMIVFLLIVFFSVIRDTIKSEDTFRSKIDSKLVGVIPHERKRMKLIDRLRKKKKALLINETIFVSLKFSESFHKISAKIEYLNHRYGNKVFAITSVAENEGKSTTASNVAISLANRGNTVLLMDLDTKKPALYKIFELEPQKSSEFADLISGKIKISDYSFRRYKKTRLFLALNTKAHKGHEKYIENGTIASVLESVKQRVDYVILDTPPISVDSGITTLVKNVDKTFMVVRTDTVHTSAINDAILTIKEVGGKFGGCILNDVPPEFSFFGQSGFDEGGYYSRYGRYGKYGKYGRYGKYSRYEKYSKYGRYIAISNGPENTIAYDLKINDEETEATT